jgi:hypothetical protein
VYMSGGGGCTVREGEGRWLSAVLLKQHDLLPEEVELVDVSASVMQGGGGGSRKRKHTLPLQHHVSTVIAAGQAVA